MRRHLVAVELLDGAALGGVDGLDELYRVHVPNGVRLAFLVSGDIGAAEDAAHDAFVRVASGVGRLRSAEAFGAYYRRAVVNAVLAAARSDARRVSRERRSIEGQSELTPADGEHELLAIVGQLPPRQRAALVLRYWSDLDDRAIASTLGCRRSTVRSLVARGLSQLREELSHE